MASGGGGQLAELPTGTVTFLFTDLEVSTRLWDQEPDAMRAALARHDAILHEGVAAHGGWVVKGRGDGVHAVFATADAAVRAAVDCELAMGVERWPVSEPLRVRIGIHTGVAELRDGDYFGSAVNRAARLEAIAHGGQIVCSQTTADLARDALAEGVVMVDLGEHRLRDLSRPERVFQVNAPGLTGTFARLRTLDAFPGKLPAQLSSFVGREREVAELAQLLGEKRLVTLTGVGGVGKTRLALQVAAEVLDRFADGAWLCGLAAVRDSAGVVDAVAAVFQVTARPGMTLEESLVADPGDQELLIVLDNCEHVLGPVAALVRGIEGACARVRVLATSREGLSVRGEQIIAVPSLEVPGDTTDVAEVTACEAVRLFVDRAQGAKASFVIEAGNADAVAEVCRRLDGVPLAIELAAARITAMNPAELDRRLDRRFRLLIGGDRDAIERHQTLRATIDWSYDLLSEPEQRLLDRLSVFAGGCTLDAAEAVCAGDPIEGDDIFELLASLVSRSLVVADDTGPDTRYRLLETIRQYGEERLADTGDTNTLRARHCDHYIEFAGATRADSYGAEQVEWGARLARDRDNLLAAMAFALAAQDVERAMGLICGIPEPSFQINEVVVFDPDAILALPGATEHPASAVALLAAGWHAIVRGDGPLALDFCEQALAAEQRLGPTPDSHLAMFSSHLRAVVANTALAPQECADHYRDAARHARADNLPGMAAFHLGAAANQLGWLDRTAAIELGTEGLALARQTGAPLAITANLTALAQALAPDDPDQARDLLDESVQLAATLGYENPMELNATVYAAARLAAWPETLQATSRTFHLQLRSGSSMPPIVLAGMLNLAANGLAEHRPEAAAVIQGTVGVVLRQVTRPTPERGPVVSAQPDSVMSFVAEARHHATEVIIAALGEARMRQLRAQGATMNQDQTCKYARTHINEYLATIDETHDGRDTYGSLE